MCHADYRYHSLRLLITTTAQGVGSQVVGKSTGRSLHQPEGGQAWALLI
jgi:hypothetical protein